MDRLRALGIEKDLPIPQIAVMGDQSSGKSSVLESLSGIPFPRGAGLVTRCATELRMKNKKGFAWSAHISLTWDRPQPLESGPVSSPDEIGPKIEKLTEILLQTRGKNASFESEHNILIELVSPDVPDLTIIDLPGIIRTTLEGQSRTVVTDVDSLLQRYLDQKRTIILAVIPSNVDIATVDIIERASKADPDGDRTVGVLTKPDMIGDGAEKEKVDTLQNKNKPLKLGYIMVKNRSQKQIDDGVTLYQAKALEQAWFAQHPDFRLLDSSLFGVDNLAKKLTSILVDRIKDALPDLHKEISHVMEKTSNALKTLGQCPPSKLQDMRVALSGHLKVVISDIRDAVGGNYDTHFLQNNNDTRICARFRMLASDFNQTTIKSQPLFSVEEIKTRIREMRGRELPGFPKFSVFEYMVRDFVGKWRSSAQMLLAEVEKMAVEACNQIIQHHVRRYNRLEVHLRVLLQDILTSRATEARTEALEALITNELVPMTENHYFMDIYNKSRSALFERILERAFLSVSPKSVPIPQAPAFGFGGFGSPAPLPAASAAKSKGRIDYDDQCRLGDLRTALMLEYTAVHSVGTEPNETQEAEDLKAMLYAYWKASSKRFVDNAVQTIDRVLLRNLDSVVFERFDQVGLSEQQLVDLFVEEQHVCERRRMLSAKLARLQKANAVLGELDLGDTYHDESSPAAGNKRKRLQP